MNRRSARLLIWLVLPPVVLAAAAMGAANSLSPWQWVAAIPARPADALPCDLVARREVSPLAVPEGGSVNVKVTYDYNCVERPKKVNFILIVEDTFEGGEDVQSELESNLREGLRNFVAEATFGEGSQGGLTLVDRQFTSRVALGGGGAGKQALLDAIERITLQRIGSSAGFGPAIRDAVDRLSDAGGDAEPWLIIFDRGAPETPMGNPPPPITAREACAYAHDRGVHVAIVWHEDAGGRMRECATDAHDWSTVGPTAPDLPNTFNDVAIAVMRHQLASDTWYTDATDPAHWELVPGSGRPRDPDEVSGNAIRWADRPDGKPVGGYTIEYQWRALGGAAPYVGRLSLDRSAGISLNWSAGPYFKHWFDNTEGNPEVCVYRRGREAQDCGLVAGTATGTATHVRPIANPTERPIVSLPVVGNMPAPCICTNVYFDANGSVTINYNNNRMSIAIPLQISMECKGDPGGCLGNIQINQDPTQGGNGYMSPGYVLPTRAFTQTMPNDVPRPVPEANPTITLSYKLSETTVTTTTNVISGAVISCSGRCGRRPSYKYLASLNYATGLPQRGAIVGRIAFWLEGTGCAEKGNGAMQIVLLVSLNDRRNAVLVRGAPLRVKPK